MPFAPGNVIGAATSNQSGGPEAAIADLAFNTPIYAAEVVKRNVFAGLTFDANDTTQFMMNLFGGQTESNDYDQRGIPHLSGIWNGRVYNTNPYLPGERSPGDARSGRRLVHPPETRHRRRARPGNWNEDEERHNQFESWTLQLGVDKELGDNWRMQARLQRGATDRYTTVLNEVRVDREILGDRRRRGVHGSTRRQRRRHHRSHPRKSARHRQHHLQRAALQPDGRAAAGGRRGSAVPAADQRHEPRRSHRSRADPGPGRPGRDPELRADERLRSGQREPSGA